MSAHTPGPWKLLNNGRMSEIFGADCGSIMHDHPFGPSSPVNPADWRLIAAAPELLAALKLMLAGTDEDCGRIRCPDKSAVTAAFSAIAKAEGR